MGPFRPRRSLGQSFLIHKPTADLLVAALNLKSGDTVLEIGPGKGILTRRLVEKAGRVVAVEIDERLVRQLQSELGCHPGFELVHLDFMAYNMKPLGCVKVIGNLPYSISSQILFRLLDSVNVWEMAVLTAQREFARRVLAGPGTKAYGALSVFLERVCKREKLFDIPPLHFRPRPDVVSTSFRLTKRQEPLFTFNDEVFFKRVVKAGFRQRRKTLANNLSAELGLKKEDVDNLLAECGIDVRARAESLDVWKFRCLVRVAESSV
ncbi:ribosomal RNA small subunit methyltransferase A [candidate division WOR-3 bacterium JGI_Cruoil_03_51_56]|uniref:Ribosomal RNA small subunit methyltransferase A n=1 Tax=candidate division WOR-3 bacterium JGI_Cruoil_03_51_56 TaxID=1973747 RepID=A0A235BV64_UNCW3|nr:MAG: ribosomal RNA small subunit methyltransferase A [candidate division WOR-3 bacterium JGI_Cruoil_03_51_56]